MSDDRRIIMLGGTPIAPDPRIENGAMWAAQAGWQVHVLGWDRDGNHPRQEIRDGYTITRLSIKAGFGRGLKTLLPLIKWQFYLLLWLLQHRSEYSVIKASDLDTGLIGMLVAASLHKRLIYDIHDFYADSRKVPACAIGIVRRLERIVAKRADILIQADEMRQAQLGVPGSASLRVICNTPCATVESYSIQPPGGELRIAYVGPLSGVRGLNVLLTVCQRNPQWRLDLAGYSVGDFGIDALVEQLPNVHFHGRIPSLRALDLYASSQVIICTYDPSIPNHRFSSPNKIAEALMLGRPLVVARGTNVDSLVEAYHLGYVVQYGDPDSLEAALLAIRQWSVEDWRQFQAVAGEIYQSRYDWKLMRRRFQELLVSITSLSDASSA